MSDTRSVKFKAAKHSEWPNAVNKFMIVNGFGALVGGNRHEFILFGNMNRRCCPTAFSSQAAVERYMVINYLYLKEMSEYCAKVKARDAKDDLQVAE